MMARGVLEGQVMRTQQAFGLNGGFPGRRTFLRTLQQPMGTINDLFVARCRLIMRSLPTYIVAAAEYGARDMSFPVMNQIFSGVDRPTGRGSGDDQYLLLGSFRPGGLDRISGLYRANDFTPVRGRITDMVRWALADFGTHDVGDQFWPVTIFKETRAGHDLCSDAVVFTWTVACAAIIMVFLHCRR